MANKVISIKTNQKKLQRDDSINNLNVIDSISANNEYVYMDIDMIAQLKKEHPVSLSSIHQTDYILGTEKVKRVQYPVVAEITDEEVAKIFLNSNSSIRVTKKIYDYVESLRKGELDPSRIKYDEELSVYIYRY